MRISALEEYGLRCALVLARHYGNGPLPSSKIAELEGISTEYASKILYLLRSSQLVSAERGTQGGFRLSRDPLQISLKLVFDALAQKRDIGDSKGSSWCEQFSGNQETCVHFDDCSIRPVWSLVAGFFDDVLNRVTLADLIHCEEAARSRIEKIAGTQAQRLTATLKETEKEKQQG
jgi:Rrf2 family protein